MSTASITHVQEPGFFAQAVSAIREFSVALYAARDREFAVRHAEIHAPVVPAREKQKSRKKLLSLAAESDSHSPSLAAELRNIAGRG